LEKPKNLSIGYLKIINGKKLNFLEFILRSKLK
jgi:hypothetical protein